MVVSDQALTRLLIPHHTGDFPHRVVGSSVGGEVISLSSSCSPDRESKAGPSGDKPASLVPPVGAVSTPVIIGCPMMGVRLVCTSPQPGHVILCRRLVASSSPSPHVSSCDIGSSAFSLLAMDELRGRLQASRSFVRTYDACVAVLQAQSAIMEARVVSTHLPCF